MALAVHVLVFFHRERCASSILVECLLISSLPAEALRTLVDSTCVLEAESGKLDIKRCEPEASSTM